MKLAQTFVTPQKGFTKSVQTIALQIIKIKSERYLSRNYR